MRADPLLPPYALVVVDTNVLLSAALVRSGTAALLVDRLLAHGKLVFTEVTFAEMESRIWKPRFDRYLSMETRRTILRELNASACWVDVPDRIAQQRHSRDPSDDAFIHAAKAAGVTRLVSGDDDLLCLDPLGELRILSPRDALGELGAGS
ncbi:MAG: putative toxin-antitoxin system toxin component, PIN family [Rhodocyclaceae bacterium]|nr:MAG: putative toxin-antitoxin system toxin component, PIN family [Rhodocyclaceae bacterium]